MGVVSLRKTNHKHHSINHPILLFLPNKINSVVLRSASLPRFQSILSELLSPEHVHQSSPVLQNKEQIPFVVLEQQQCRRSRAGPCLLELPLFCLVPGAQRQRGFAVMGRAMWTRDRIVSSPAPMETARQKSQHRSELISGLGSVPGSPQTPGLSCCVFIVI